MVSASRPHTWTRRGVHIQNGNESVFQPAQLATSDKEKGVFGITEQHTVQTNWYTFEDRPLSLASFIDVFMNRVPVVREPGFLTPEERRKMLEVVRTHREYDTENTWPRVRVAGITQYDHIKDKNLYVKSVEEARLLQRRWKNEAGVDIIQHIAEKLRQTTNMKVEVARGDDEYFAGVLRAVDRGIGVHADYAPYVSLNWHR
ncbi:uncharacterized protein BCR38DRAFT_416567 [Pseudomassariella vexata]|uniref:Uncharacterized protein n=1 Tax=Pseudomassariella vexata TaxID=1141098 RepID=A0A1Y2EIE9_9PEZI|nr:uncharacterized protein BCR38DRAFT_416567 [Pseudomassariella vexata]ORY71361.1 hypothetical protein BCR38DRAFT_416567 [Pseudomassariella vexata]